jgi:hypothetical protein
MMMSLSAGVPLTVKSLAWTVAGSAGSLRLTVNSVGGVPTTMPPQAVLVTEQPVGVAVAVGVGVGVGGENCAQYLPPVFRSPESPRPPQTIIWLPLQIAVWPYRVKGASVVLVAAQVSVLGLYLPPVPGGVGVGVPVAVAVGLGVIGGGSEGVGVGAESCALYPPTMFGSLALSPIPPQTIISLSVQTAV